MFKRLAAPFFLLCFLLAGCFFAPVDLDYAPPASYADPNYEEMEIYQYLSQAITGNSSLDEMLDAFAEMSEIPVDSTTDMYLYEVYDYTFEGEEYLNCHIVRQVDEPGTDEYIQLYLDITYLYDEDMAGFEEVIWFDRNATGFLEHIRNGELYRILLDRPIHESYVSISST